MLNWYLLVEGSAVFALHMITSHLLQRNVTKGSASTVCDCSECLIGNCCIWVQNWSVVDCMVDIISIIPELQLEME